MWKSLFIFLIAFYSFATAQQVTLFGSVKDSVNQKPISNVIVSIVGQYTYDTTDVSGNFGILYSSVLEGKHAISKSSPFYLHNGTLTINLNKSDPVRIWAYNINGKLVAASNYVWNRGVYTVPPLVRASGVYVYRLQIGNNSYSVKFTRMDDGMAIGSVRSRESFTSTATSNTQLEKFQSAKRIDTLLISGDGYYVKKVPIVNVTSKINVVLRPVVLNNGVRSGKWDLVSGLGNTACVYVNQNKKAIDSIRFNITLYCISTTYNTSYVCAGPFVVPQNGVVNIGDSVKINFTDTSVSGTFSTKNTIAMTTANQCNWTVLSYLGSGYMTQIFTHYNHLFKLDYQVYFSSIFYSLQIISEHGIVGKSPDKNFFFPGETVLLSARPDSLYGFRSWSGVIASSSMPTTAQIVMNGNKTVTATFGNNFEIAINVQNGKVFQNPYYSSYDPGDTVKLIGQPSQNYCCATWGGDVIKTSQDSAWIVMNNNKSVSVTFSPTYYLLASADHGQFIKSPQKAFFKSSPPFDTAMLIAKPDSGFVFKEWSGTFLKTSGDTAWVIMSQNITVSAKFIMKEIRFIYKLLRNDVYRVGFTPDNSMLVLGMGDSVTLWGKLTGAYIRTFCTLQSGIVAMKFTTDGTKMWTASGKGKIDLWDYATGANIKSIEGTLGQLSFADFSKDFSKALCGYYQAAVLWDLTTGKELQTFVGHQGYVFAMAISPDGSKVATCSDDQMWRIFDVATGTCLLKIPEYISTGKSLLFSKDGSVLISISSLGNISRYNVATGALIKSYNLYSAEGTAFTSDEKLVAVGTWNRGIQIVDVETCSLIKVLDGHSHPLNAVAFSSDNSQLLSTSMDSTAILWDLK